MQPLRASIIAIGSEMLGTTRVDTNSLKITAALQSHGIDLVRKSVVGDRLDDLVRELQRSVADTDIVITSGGLGPTEDDLTRDAIAKAFGLAMEVDQSIIDRIEARFAKRGLKAPEVNKRQANVFTGQTTLRNERGTAPGFHIAIDLGERGGGSRRETRDLWVFPGVPHELEWMVTTYFVPWLAELSGGRARHTRILKIAGLTESGVEERLAPYYAAHPGELLTILASPTGIEVHLVSDAAESEAHAFLRERERELLAILGDRVFGYDDDTLEGVVGAMLAQRGETLATAESCTGGLVAMRITEVAGSSAYFRGGVVAYDARAKQDLAHVPEEAIQRHGEVSEEVAVALAAGVRERFGTTWGIGVTGIAGPGGGTPDKPVGTVHIAVASAAGSEHRKIVWAGVRHQIRWYSSQAVLDLLRRAMLGKAE